jgi:hypothetical protein
LTLLVSDPIWRLNDMMLPHCVSLLMRLNGQHDGNEFGTFRARHLLMPGFSL